MRVARVKVRNCEAVYHCVARAVAGERLFGETEREFLRKHLRDCARFAGVELLTFAILSNHYHVLVRVVPAKTLSDAELVERVRALLRDQVADELAIALQKFPATSPRGEEIRMRILRQMHDISAYIKLVNQWFSTWFNKVHERFGTVWAERFKSTLVGGNAIQTVSAYIDLNPVRAGLCTDPKDYRFCGYAEAVAGITAAQEGIKSVTGYRDWQKAHDHYRSLLFGTGEYAPERKGKRQATMSPAAVKEVFRAGGQLSISDLLRCRVRYFTDGLALGSEEFVEAIRANLTELGWPGGKRTPKPRTLGEVPAFDGFRVLRNLRGSPIS